LRQQASQRASGPASQPASQSGPLSALLSKENALKIIKPHFFDMVFLSKIRCYN